MNLEQLKKESREEFNEEYSDGMTPPKDLYSYFIEPNLKKAYLQGIRDAKGCVPEEKELSPYPGDRRGGIENQILSQENNLKAGFNNARTSTLEAITRLEETYE